MKNLCLTVLLIVMAFVPHARAESVSADDIAVVDVVVLLRDSKASKSIESQIQDYRKDFKEEIASQEKELRNLETDLVENKDKLEPEQFTKKRKTFEKKLRELQTNTQKKRFSLDKSASKAVGTLQAEITKIVGQMAKDNDYKLVITRDQVVVVTSDIDITNDVMTALDEKLPKIKVEVE